MLKILLLISSLFLAEAEKRVKRIILKENRPLKISLYAGRASLLRLPCMPYKALIGSPKDISVSFDESEIHLLLKKFRAEPTNLIVKCSGNTLIFDIIPSQKIHNDFIEVLSVISNKIDTKSKLTRKNTPSKKKGGFSSGFKIKTLLKSFKELK